MTGLQSTAKVPASHAYTERLLKSPHETENPMRIAVNFDATPQGWEETKTQKRAITARDVAYLAEDLVKHFPLARISFYPRSCSIEIVHDSEDFMSETINTIREKLEAVLARHAKL